MNTINNILYQKTCKNPVDQILMKYYHQINKKILEKEYYDHGVIASWGIKFQKNSLKEFLYCKYTNDNKENLISVYKNSTQKFILPDYQQYLNYYKVHNNTLSINGKILKKITGNTEQLLDIHLFENNINMIIKNNNDNFHDIYQPDYNTLQTEKVISNIKSDKINNGVLSFMGCYQYINACTLKEIFIYKILEKYYGSGESSTIYNSYRMNGDIYSTCSGCDIDTKIMYTGILSSYNNDIFDDVVEKIHNISINTDELLMAKQRLIDDLYFCYFQYGEQITIMPYLEYINHKITFDNVISIINDISINEFMQIQKQKKYSLRMVI